MKELELFQAVGEVDDGILQDAEEFLNRTPGKGHAPAVRRAPVWVKWGSLAACAALAVCAVWALRPAGEPGQRPQVDVPQAPAVTQSTPNEDRPAVEPGPEELARPAVELRFNELAGEPQNVYSMFPLMAEDFVPMTRQELLDYYGVSLPVEELFPLLSNLEPEGTGSGRGIYRREDWNIYWDGNTFSFTSADGVQAVYIALDKAFHLPSSPWELPGESLTFTDINGWELALFLYPDEAGGQCFYTEFRQNGVNYRVTGKNLAEGEFAALLEALLEEREDFTPGEVRTFRGTYGGGIGHQFLTTRNPDGSAGVEESWCGPLHLDLDNAAEYSTLNIELTPEQAAQFAELPPGGRVVVSFVGEPATVGTVWNQQLVSIETPQAK